MSKWYQALAIGIFLGALSGFFLASIIEMEKRGEFNSELARRYWNWIKSGGKNRRFQERRKGERRG